MNPDTKPFDYSPFLIQDLANLARTTKSIRMSRACTAAMEELIHHRRNGTTRDNPVIRFLEDRVRYLEDKLLSTPPPPGPSPHEETIRLRARVEELEGIIDWHIDMVVGDAWLCRIEGKYEDIDLLLGNAVGKEIQAYEIDTSHHENTHE